MSDEEIRAADRAARLVESHRAADTRRRTLAIVFISCFAIASILGASKILVLRNHKGSSSTKATPRHSTPEFSFLLTPTIANGKKSATPAVTITIYEDFLCKGCATFEKKSSNFLRGAVKSGRINVEYHPFTFLIGASTNRYAERAANAAACVADDAGMVPYLAFHDELFAHQPKEATAGPSDAVLIALAKKAGTGDIKACVADEKFADWVTEAAVKGRDVGLTSAPAIAVNGQVLNVTGAGRKPVIPGPADLEKAIRSSGG